MQGVTVTLTTVTVNGRDGYGNDATITSTRDVTGCAFVPQQTSESTQGAEEVIANAKLYLPAGTVVGHLDRIEYNGVTYQVQGNSSAWVSPFTASQSPVMVDLREVSGGSAHTVSAAGAGG